MASHGASVHLQSVRRTFDDVVAVDNLSLDVPAGSFFSLLGPSGCGKSTTLRMIAGFELPDAGRIEIDGLDVTGVPARKRPTAMVFQNYALFPHMTVGENVGYGLTVRRVGKSEVRRRVHEALARVEMTVFVDTLVTKLSGGQQQRVALARAVAVEPQVILFDEPLSNLDVALRHQTRRELKALQHRIGLTSIYVTHDQEEAMALSDWVAVMRSGRIIQTGRPEDLYKAPETAFVASFLGGANVIQDPQAVGRLCGQRLPDGNALVVRAEDLEVSESGIEVVVESRQFLGYVTELMVNMDETRLRILVPGAFETDGDRTRIGLKSSRFVTNDL